MKAVSIFLWGLLMLSPNLAKDATSTEGPEQQIKQNLSMKILYELLENSRTFGMYLEKMNAIENKMNSVVSKMNTLEVKMDSIEGKVDLMENNINSTNNVTDFITIIPKMDSLENKMDLLENKMNSSESKVDSVITEMNSVSSRTSTTYTKVNSLVSKVDSVSSKMNSVSSRTSTINSKVNTANNQLDSMYRQCAEGEPCNCMDLKRKGFTKSGIYTISVPVSDNHCITRPIEVYCDMDTDGGGWLVFQRRKDGSENFYRGWTDYKNGFGSMQNEFWLGNEDLYQILNTCGNQHQLRVDLEDFDNAAKYAKYSTFNIGSSAVNYRLTIGTYSGTAGDSLKQHNGQQFSTYDRDNDNSPFSCALHYKGGWWYTSCHHSNLNGPYMRGTITDQGKGIIWNKWRGNFYSLKFTEMKIRPK